MCKQQADNMTLLATRRLIDLQGQNSQTCNSQTVWHVACNLQVAGLYFRITHC